MKKDQHQFYLIIGTFIMLILIFTGRERASEPVDNYLYAYELKYGAEVVAENRAYFSLETGRDVADTIFNFPWQLWNMILNPSESQMRFFLRDGFAFSGNESKEEEIEETEETEEIEEVVRIGQTRDDSEEIYMLTWQPADGFVRQSQLIHDQDEEMSIPRATYINSDEPLVYIFNSHPAEMIGGTFGDLRIGQMNIVELSHEIALIFEEYDIPSLVEDRDVRDVLRSNSWNFAASYQASRIFIEERIHQYPTLQFFFDIHRDGIPWDLARVDIDDRPYAKVLFVIGTDNPAGYAQNYRMARRLHDLLEERRPGISRGIMTSSGVGRNGIYNQDVASTLQLIEIGTVETTVEEAMNTIEILADVLAEYILMYVEY